MSGLLASASVSGVSKQNPSNRATRCEQAVPHAAEQRVYELMTNTTAMRPKDAIVPQRMEEQRDSTLTQLLQRAAPRGLRIATRLIGPADAEDAVQEALARTMLELRRVREPEAWFIRVLVNHCLGIQRRQQLKRLLPWRWRAAPESLGPARPADEQLAEARRAADLRDSVQRLPPMQRTVVQLRYGEDLSSAEIAATLGVSTETVKTHLARAVSRLRTNLEDNR